MFVLLMVGYIFLYVYRPFEIWPWLGPMHVERIYAIIMILAWLPARKQLIFNKTHLAVLFLTVAFVSSWLVSEFREQGGSDMWFYLKACLLYLMIVTTVFDERRLRWLIYGFLIVVFIYMAHSLREFVGGRHVYRMGIARMVGIDETYRDPNTFAATILYSFPMLIPVWNDPNRPKFARPLAMAYAALSVTCVMLTGSRSGFVGMVFLAGCIALTSRHRMTMLVLMVLLAPAVWFLLGDELQDRYLTLIDPSRGPASAQMSASGRMGGFLRGIDLWTRKPILGYGPNGFRFATGQGAAAHNLYGQVLSETGTAGALGLLSLIACWVANAWEARRRLKSLADATGQFSGLVATSVIYTLLLLLLLGWGGHNLFRYHWLWFSAFQVSGLYILRTNQRQAWQRTVQPVVPPEMRRPMYAG